MPAIDTDMLVCDGLIIPWSYIIGLHNIETSIHDTFYIDVLLHDGMVRRINGVHRDGARSLFKYYFDREVAPRIREEKDYDRVFDAFWRSFSGDE